MKVLRQAEQRNARRILRPPRPGSTVRVILDWKSKIYNLKPLLEQPHRLRLLHRWYLPQPRQHFLRYLHVHVDDGNRFAWLL